MQNGKLARRYATAVFALAREANAVDVVGTDLRAMTATLASSPALERFFLSPVFQRKEKERLLHDAFGPNAHVISLHALLLLVRKRREALLGAIASEYATLALEAAGKEPLEIVSARALAPDDLAAIVARLGRGSGKAFDVTTRTDPSLLGGVRITMGDRRIDGSLAGRIDDLARDLVART